MPMPQPTTAPKRRLRPPLSSCSAIDRAHGDGFVQAQRWISKPILVGPNYADWRKNATTRKPNLGQNYRPAGLTAQIQARSPLSAAIARKALLGRTQDEV